MITLAKKSIILSHRSFDGLKAWQQALPLFDGEKQGLTKYFTIPSHVSPHPLNLGVTKKQYSIHLVGLKNCY